MVTNEAVEREIQNINNEIERTAFKEEEGLTQYEKQVRILELQRCGKSFRRFLKWVQIIEAPTYTSPGGVIPLQLWPDIKKIVVNLTDPEARLYILLKARQVGASWIIAAYVLWYALFHMGALVILLSRGEPEVIKLLDKCRDIYEQLPPFMMIERGADSKTELTFPFMKSSIMARAATDTMGVSYQASIIVMDECQDMEYAEKIWFNAKPCIDQGGQFIIVYTSPKPDLDKLCVNIFKQAMKKRNNFRWQFIPYWGRPGRDEAWYKKKYDEVRLDVSELSGLTPELYMERTYPRSVEEALSDVSSVSVFDHRILDEMAGETKNPMKEGLPDGVDPKLVHIYQLWQIGSFYIAASDTGHGVGLDYSITIIMNCKTGAVVADIMSNSINESDFAYHSLKLMDVFHSPLWYIETNDWGQVIVNIALRDGYRNLGYQDKARNKPGIRTTGGEDGRTLLWGTLIPAINTHQITIYNPEGIKHFRDVIRNTAKQGRIEARKGGHDDYPMAVGIAWMRREEVKPPTMLITGKRF